MGLLLCAQLFFYLSNTSLFQPTGVRNCVNILWGNIRFGLATVCTFLSPYILLNLIPSRELRWNKIYHGITEALYIILTLIVVIPTIIDASYFQFTYRRLSCEIFQYLTIGGDMGNLLPKFLLDYWPSTVCSIVLIAILVVMQNITHLDRRSPYASHTVNDIVGFVLGIAVTVLLMRGGFARHWIRPCDSARYAIAKETPLVENSAYNILQTLLLPEIQTPDINATKSSSQTFNPLFTPLYRTIETPVDTLTALADSTATNSIRQEIPTKKNVVVIIFEGFSQEYMGCYNPDIETSYTPFLDSLATISTLYQGRSNGKKSIEAIPAVFASIPTLMDKPFILSKYKNNDIYALPTILANEGYHTAFFHGSYNGTMGFDTFCRKAGFKEYYGKNEYGDMKDYDGTWGIYDEPFLQFTAQRLETFKQPFLAGVFTISAHHPYSIPEQHIGDFKKGEHPILECVMYSDYALRRFFETASKQDWFRNTIFIITGDHPAQPLSRKYNSYDMRYAVPMIIFDPSDPTPHRSNRIMQQTDIMPSVIDMLCINKKFIAFGSSIFRDKTEGFHIVYGDGFIQLSKQGSLTVVKGQRIEQYGHDNQNTDFINSYMRQYYDRMEHNNLIP
ncbi:MAG: sulfatase-like hydrolase/transferase [Bacteroidales bacterium]|nr:sulfatase-like hydrolase/transferase [Bacteroidales bacterium]